MNLSIFFSIDCKHDEQPWEIIGLGVFPNIFRLNSQSVAVLVHWKRQNVPWQGWNWGRRGDQNPELAGDSHFLSGFLVILRWIIIRNSAKACFSMFFSCFCSSIFFFSGFSEIALSSFCWGVSLFVKKTRNCFWPGKKISFNWFCCRALSGSVQF